MHGSRLTTVRLILVTVLVVLVVLDAFHALHPQAFLWAAFTAWVGWWSTGWFRQATPADTGPSFQLAALDYGILWGVTCIASPWMGMVRGLLPITPNELRIFPPTSWSALDWYLSDSGIPSLVHGLLLLPLRHVGGHEVLFIAHLVLWVLSTLLAFDILHRRLGAWPARVVLPLLALSPAWLFQFLEYRSYATYLFFVTWAGWNAVRCVDAPERSTQPVYVGLSLAALDALNALPLLVAFAAWDALRPGRPGGPSLAALQRPLTFLVGCVPLTLLTTGVHAHGAQPLPLWGHDRHGMYLAAVLTLGALLGAIRERTPSATLAAAGGLTFLGLVHTGTLRYEHKYILFVAPLLLAEGARGLYRLSPSPRDDVPVWVVVPLPLLILWDYAIEPQSLLQELRFRRPTLQALYVGSLLVLLPTFVYLRNKRSRDGGWILVTTLFASFAPLAFHTKQHREDARVMRYRLAMDRALTQAEGEAPICVAEEPLRLGLVAAHIARTRGTFPSGLQRQSPLPQMDANYRPTDLSGCSPDENRLVLVASSTHPPADCVLARDLPPAYRLDACHPSELSDP